MAGLTKKQLAESLTAIEGRLKSLEQKLPEGVTLESAITQVNESITKAKSLSNEAETLTQSIRSQKQEIDQTKENIDSIETALEDQKATLLSDKEDFEKFRQSFDETQNKTKELQTETETQLGLVSAEKLANSFNDEAEKLKTSTAEWFSRVKWTSIALVTAVIGIAWWQLSTSETIFELSFLIRATLTTPIIWFLYFSAHNYNEEKSLLDNYLFKAAVARSFEAYRQLLRSQFESYEGAEGEESNKLSDVQEREIEFILATIKGIYSSPIPERGREKITKTNLGPLDELLSIAEKIKNLQK